MSTLPATAWAIVRWDHPPALKCVRCGEVEPFGATFKARQVARLAEAFCGEHALCTKPEREPEDHARLECASCGGHAFMPDIDLCRACKAVVVEHARIEGIGFNAACRVLNVRRRYGSKSAGRCGPTSQAPMASTIAYHGDPIS